MLPVVGKLEYGSSIETLSSVSRNLIQLRIKYQVPYFGVTFDHFFKVIIFLPAMRRSLKFVLA